jgi:integrase
MAYAERVGKRWRGVYRDHEGKKRSKVHRLKGEAERWVALEEDKVEQGIHTDPDIGAATLATYVERFLETYRGNPKISPARLDHVQRVLRTRVLVAFGDKSLRSLQAREIQIWINAMHSQGIAPKSTRAYAGVLQLVLNAAVEDGYLQKSPFTKKVKDQLPDPRHEERPRYLEPDEAERLIAAIPDRYRALIVLGLASGARWGELVGLRRQRYNPLRKEIEIRESLHELNGREGGRFWLDKPKTPQSVRTIALPQYAVDALNTHIDTFPPAGTIADDLIFTTSRGSEIDRGFFRGKVFLPACARAGIDGLTFHHLRHTSATWLLSDGIPVTVVSKRLGHATVSVTLDIYSHCMQGSDDLVVASLDRRFDRLGWGTDGAGTVTGVSVGIRR